jgi:hypothetical protein
LPHPTACALTGVGVVSTAFAMEGRRTGIDWEA